MHTVMIVDDHPVVIEGVRSILAGHELRIVGWALERDSAVRLAEDKRPDVLILDLRLGGQFVPDMCQQLASVTPQTKIVMHTAYENVEPLRACLHFGAMGVVFKDGHHLVAAIRHVLSGNAFIEPRLTEAIWPRRNMTLGNEVFEPLSPREYDILCALALGQSTSEISTSLRLTDNTVRSYIKSLLTKLHAHSRIEAVATARRLRLL